MNHLTPTTGPVTVPPSTTQPDKIDDVSCPEHDQQTASNSKSPPSGGFLGVSISMDVRKWAWPSFGKGPGSKELMTNAGGDAVPRAAPGSAETQVDQNALEDAITSDNSFGLPAEKSSALDEREKHLVQPDDDVQEVEADTPRPSRVPSPTLDVSMTPPNGSLSGVDAPTAVCCEKPQFTWTDVFLAPRHDPLATSRKRIYLLKRDQYVAALLGNDVEDVETWVEPTSRLLEDAGRIVNEDSQRNMTTSLPSATKILQPKDRRILKTGGYVNASGEATLSSDRLFEAKGLLDR
ncbi:hypothetical protein JVU11DRAFT_6401 [Chiua virens]|nr:hypothetical protein JVU11DRAFT_6401 [Chiua virens]